MSGWELLGVDLDRAYMVVPVSTYFEDFLQSETETFIQLQCDVPRANVRFGTVHIADGELLWDMLNSWLNSTAALQFSRLCTQTALALPMREIHACLPEDIFVAETRPASPLTVQICTDPPHVSVRKRLRLCTTSDLRTCKMINISVQYGTQDTHVHIRWCTSLP